MEIRLERPLTQTMSATMKIFVLLQAVLIYLPPATCHLPITSNVVKGFS
jgi:hypothetical protein